MSKTSFSVPKEETFFKKESLCQMYQISPRTAELIIRFIRQHIPDRYPAEAQIHTGRIIRIRGDVFADAIRWKDEIEKGIAPDFPSYGMACKTCKYYRKEERHA